MLSGAFTLILLGVFQVRSNHRKDSKLRMYKQYGNLHSTRIISPVTIACSSIVKMAEASTVFIVVEKIVFINTF